MNSKKKYDEFVQMARLPLFSQPWWLDAVCGEENWDVVVVEEDGKPIGAMPYFFKKKNGVLRLTQPPLTQTLGPFWLCSSSKKRSKQLSRQKKILNALIESLPHFDYFCQNFHYSITNWLPFYWAGYSQTTCYTYLIDELTDLDNIWNGFQENIKTDIRKAEKRKLIIDTDLDLDHFLDVHALTFRRQNIPIPYSRDLVYCLDLAVRKNAHRKIFYAKDNVGQIHCAVYIVWNADSAFYLMGGGDPKLRNSGATSLLLWEAIKFVSLLTERFDFEGSMLESVEKFFRAFGAKQVPYFKISKQSKRAQIYSSFRDLIEATKKIFG